MYLKANPDVAAAVQEESFGSALQHFLLYGVGEILEGQRSAKGTPTALLSELTVNGEVRVLTTKPETVEGTMSDDLFLGFINADQDSRSTFTSGDRLDGGGGKDTLKLRAVGARDRKTEFKEGMLSNIETVRITDMSQGTDFYDFKHVSGLRSVIDDKSHALAHYDNLDRGVKLVFVGGPGSYGYDAREEGSPRRQSHLTMKHLASDANVEVRGGVRGLSLASNSPTPEMFLYSTGVAKNQIYNLNPASGFALEGTTLTIDADADLDIGYLGNVGGRISTPQLSIVVTGKGRVAVLGQNKDYEQPGGPKALRPLGGDDGAKIQVIDASQNSGGVSLRLGEQPDGQRVVGGSGNDTFYVSALNKIDAGAGQDTLFLLSGDALGHDFQSTYSNFGIVGVGSGVETDLSGVRSINGLKIDGSQLKDAEFHKEITIRNVSWAQAQNINIVNPPHAVKQAVNIHYSEHFDGDRKAIFTFDNGGDTYKGYPGHVTLSLSGTVDALNFVARDDINVSISIIDLNKFSVSGQGAAVLTFKEPIPGGKGASVAGGSDDDLLTFSAKVGAHDAPVAISGGKGWDHIILGQNSGDGNAVFAFKNGDSKFENQMLSYDEIRREGGPLLSSAQDVKSIRYDTEPVQFKATKCPAKAGVAKIDEDGRATFHSADSSLAQKTSALARAIGDDAQGTAAYFFESSSAKSAAYVFISDGVQGVTAGDVAIKFWWGLIQPQNSPSTAAINTFSIYYRRTRELTADGWKA